MNFHPYGGVFASKSENYVIPGGTLQNMKSYTSIFFSVSRGGLLVSNTPSPGGGGVPKFQEKLPPPCGGFQNSDVIFCLPHVGGGFQNSDVIFAPRPPLPYGGG